MSSMNKFISEDAVNNSLYKAIYCGDLEKIDVIIDSFGLNHSPLWANGYDLVLTAIECKHVDVAKLLVKKGCKLEGPQIGTSKTPKSLLHLAVIQGDVELVSMLLDGNPNSITNNDNGDSPLHVAVTEGKEEVVKLLLERGAYIESRNSGEMTPLHLASVRGRVEMLEQLLRLGCDIESKESTGKTSLFLAVSSGHELAVKILLNHGANVNCKSNNGLSPLLGATSNGYLEIVKVLLAHGADLNYRNGFGQTPLHIACLIQNKNLISVLLNAGADVNSTDNNEMVPVDALIKKVGSSIYFENSPISYVMGKHVLLLKHGGFHLSKKNEVFYKTFCNFYCKDIIVGNSVVIASKSHLLEAVTESSKEEISLMKKMKSESGFTVHDVFEKLKDPLNVTPLHEINFVESVDIEYNLPLYQSIIKNLIRHAKLRCKLIYSGQEWFSFLIHSSDNKIPTLPKEMSLNIVSNLSNDELKQFIQCLEEIYKQNSHTIIIS